MFTTPTLAFSSLPHSLLPPITFCPASQRYTPSVRGWINTLGISKLISSLSHTWCSGSTTAFQAAGPGSIPGVCTREVLRSLEQAKEDWDLTFLLSGKTSHVCYFDEKDPNTPMWTIHTLSRTHTCLHCTLSSSFLYIPLKTQGFLFDLCVLGSAAQNSDCLKKRSWDRCHEEGSYGKLPVLPAPIP